jgi:hypothetical protein
MTKGENQTKYRQGDVLITRVDKIPKGATEIASNKERGVVLAEGEVTGHAHRIPSRHAQLYRTEADARYLRDVGAAVIHADVDMLGLPRRLLRIEQPGDEPFVAVEVTNSTPEPDGQRKLYTFRCHPELRPLPIRGIRADYGPEQELTCQNAIASTYGYAGADYRPAIET